MVVWFDLKKLVNEIGGEIWFVYYLFIFLFYSNCFCFNGDENNMLFGILVIVLVFFYFLY